MPRIFITGSSDGLGRMAAELLVEQGHEVVLHARDERRADDAVAAVPGATGMVLGDLRSLAQIRSVAEQADATGRFDAVVHNAGIGYQEPRRIRTPDGLSHLFSVNVLAPYLITALMQPPDRLVYVSSGLHRQGDASLDDPQWDSRPWSGFQAYCDSKLDDVLLAFGVAQRWPSTSSNSLEPGWVATKMGGPGAPDDLAQAHLTQVWLATSDEPAATASGGYFYHRRPRRAAPAAYEVERQEALLDYCASLTGVALADQLESGSRR